MLLCPALPSSLRRRPGLCQRVRDCWALRVLLGVTKRAFYRTAESSVVVRAVHDDDDEDDDGHVAVLVITAEHMTLVMV